MGEAGDFNDKHIQITAEQDSWHPYEYQTEQNQSWAAALPVKQ